MSDEITESDLEKAIAETKRHEVQLIISDFLNQLDQAIGLTGIERIKLRQKVENAIHLERK